MGRLSRLIFGVVAGLAVAAPVSASGHCELTVVRVEAGAGFHRVSGSSFAPNEEVELQLYLGNEAQFLAPLLKIADGDGKFFDGLWFLPKDAAGTYAMRATAASCNAETTFMWALPDTAAALPTPAGPSTPDLTWAYVAGAVVFAYVLIFPRWAGARGLNTLQDTAPDLPTPAAPKAPNKPDLKWAFVAGVLMFAYVLIAPRWAGARGRKTD